MQKVPVYVISLARLSDRRRAVMSHLGAQKVEYRLIEAVDGRQLSAEQKRGVVGRRWNYPDGALGCYLSHISALEEFLRTSAAAALILEDDGRIHPRIGDLLREGLSSYDFDYCFLDSADCNDEGPIFYDAESGRGIGAGLTAYTLSAGPQTTHAFIVTRRGAERRLRCAFPAERPIDLYSHLPEKLEFAAVVSPKMAWVSEHSLNSEIMNRSGQSVNLRALRRWRGFYQFRDALKLRPLRRWLQLQSLMRAGRIEKRRRWKPIPSGREVILSD